MARLLRGDTPAAAIRRLYINGHRWKAPHDIRPKGASFLNLPLLMHDERKRAVSMQDISAAASCLTCSRRIATAAPP